MKILILSQTFPFTPTGNQGHFVLDLATGLASKGHKVTVLVPFHHKLVIHSFPKIKVISFKYIWPNSLHLIGYGQTLENDQKLKWFVPLLLPFYLLSALTALLKEVRDKKPDIVNANWIIPTGVIAAFAKKITPFPLITSIHGSDVYLGSEKIIFNALRNFAVKTSDAVTAVSPRLHLDLGSTGPVILLPIQKVKGERPKSTKLVIATAGRDVPSKGFGYIRQVCPTLEVISGLPHNEFQKKLLTVDIFIAPFSQNPTGNTDDPTLVVFEAMSAGAAVIAPNLPGYRLVIRNEKDGLLVALKSASELKKVLTKLKKDSKFRHKLASSGRKRVNRLLDPKVVAKNYIDLFSKTQIKFGIKGSQKLHH